MINNYKDLTVEKYLQLQEVDWTSMEEIDIQSTMISILADMDVEDVLDLPITEYRKMAAQLQFMTVEPKVKPRKIDNVKINGKEFYVLKDVKDMTAGQYIDYQSYIQQNDIKMLPYTLSCVIIPKGKKYGEVDAIEDIMQLSVEEALTIANFFMNKSRSLTRGTLLYLEWMMKRKMRKMKDETMKQKMEEAVKSIHSLRSLTKDGDGFLALMQFLKR